LFRIRTIHDDIHPANRNALIEVKAILRAQFGGIADADVEAVHEQLLNPFAKRFRTTLHVAESTRGVVQGFAILMHDPVANFCFLDYIASARGLTSRGIGGALYERVREESRELGAHGLFFECLPDDEAHTSSTALANQNRARLRFYEHYGARPITGTAYEMPVQPGQLDMPHLVYDDLDRDAPLTRAVAKRVVRAILERKYAHLCPPEYVAKVVGSIRTDPVEIRPPRYVVKRMPGPRPTTAPVVLVVNEHHQIHQVRDPGYVEAPVRVRVLLRDLEPTGLFRKLPAKEFADTHITAVHDARLVRYLGRVCKGVEPARSIYPYVFPVRNAAHPPKALDLQAGYWCIDTFTPLNEKAYAAARAAVNCALTAAERILAGERFAYALVRPPGHHAERAVFGGFCYFNNAAIAAQRLTRRGRVAILDIDYHHGNGQQDIFYARDDVLTISLHGHPSFAYPYFSGYENERGIDTGEGFNVNLPIGEHCTGPEYARHLERALKRVAAFRPDFLVVALGLDTARGDPTGSWTLGAADFTTNGRLIAGLRLPTLVVQEGGYRTRTLGTNARAFFRGLTAGVA
jgi:acetoin utilization deacetylase AcuC-like enzyme/GNAT superfamily N-acetyltransferase